MNQAQGISNRNRNRLLQSSIWAGILLNLLLLWGYTDFSPRLLIEKERTELLSVPDADTEPVLSLSILPGPPAMEPFVSDGIHLLSIKHLQRHHSRLAAIKLNFSSIRDCLFSQYIPSKNLPQKIIFSSSGDHTVLG